MLINKLKCKGFVLLEMDNDWPWDFFILLDLWRKLLSKDLTSLIDETESIAWHRISCNQLRMRLRKEDYQFIKNYVTITF